MRTFGKMMASVGALLLLASVVPAPAAAVTDAELLKMENEVLALYREFTTRNADYINAMRSAHVDVPASFLAEPLRTANEATAWTRASVVYDTSADTYADFIVAMHDLYQREGPMGVAALKQLTGGELEALIDEGMLPSHDTYKRFNLLAFYASLREVSNEQWLLAQPKTTERAQEKLREVMAGVSPQMREDAALLLGEAMAAAYGRILSRDGTIGGLHPAGAVEGQTLPVVNEEALVADLQTGETMAAQQASLVLTDIEPVIVDVKLTSMNQLTLILSELTSLSEIFTKIETYRSEYNYYYHYERLERTWWSFAYIVDHVEQRDTVEWRLYVQNTHRLVEYLYQYSDVMTVQGILTGVLALEYEQVVPLTGEMVDPHAVVEEVRVIANFAMPITFDINDELEISLSSEFINEVLEYVRTEVHYFWEYHIRQYWFWDPLNEEHTPFANALLNEADDYLVSVSSDLSVGKVLNVIPIRDTYREASITLSLPAAEYPLLSQATYLSPAPASFLPGQVAPGATAKKLAAALHAGPVPNAMDAEASPARLSDHVLGLLDEQGDHAVAFYGEASELAEASLRSPTALYALIPEEIRIKIPAVPSTQVGNIAVPNVDLGVDATQELTWTTTALPTFIPQFTFAGVVVRPTVDDGAPIVVSVNARGLGSPVTFFVDLNGALAEEAAAAVDGIGSGGPALGAVGEAVPAAGPLAAWAEAFGAWGFDLVAWVRETA